MSKSYFAKHLDAEFGPIYPNLPRSVAKWRSMPRTPENIQAHGYAVLKAIWNLNHSRNEGVPTARINCASGTNETDGLKILAAIRRRNHGIND